MSILYENDISLCEKEPESENDIILDKNESHSLNDWPNHIFLKWKKAPLSQGTFLKRRLLCYFERSQLLFWGLFLLVAKLNHHQIVFGFDGKYMVFFWKV